jgi:hypothetical protein
MRQNLIYVSARSESLCLIFAEKFVDDVNACLGDLESELGFVREGNGRLLYQILHAMVVPMEEWCNTYQ